MTLDEAKVFKLRWGKYKDVEFQDVVSTDDGVQYLTWLSAQTFPHKVIKEAIGVMLEAIDKNTIPLPLPPVGPPVYTKPQKPARREPEPEDEEDDDEAPF